MQKKLQTIRNQKGFTLIEIIAVLIILGILAAVAVPKYLDLQDDARNSAAQSGIAEVKGRLSSAYGTYVLRNNGAQPTTGISADLCGLAGLTCTDTETLLGDFHYKIKETGAGTTTDYVTITITKVNDVATTAGTDGLPHDDWAMPQP